MPITACACYEVIIVNQNRMNVDFKSFQSVSRAVDPKFQQFEAYFRQYARKHYSEKPELQSMVLLKENHSFRVVGHATKIMDSIHSDPSFKDAATLAALFHDIGRFPQLSKYGTFDDRQSVDHGEFGAKVLEFEGVLYGRPKAGDIIECVRYHNGFALPRNITPELELMLKVVRDADKLDILELATANYESPKMDPTLDFAAVPGGVTNEAVTEVMAERNLDARRLRTGTDMKLLRLSWIFDLTYPYSFRYVQERKIVDRILATVQDAYWKEQVRQKLNGFIEKRMF